MVEGELAIELQAQAVDEALHRGLIQRRQIEDVAVSTRARQRINRALKQVPDGRSTSGRNSRARESIMDVIWNHCVPQPLDQERA